MYPGLAVGPQRIGDRYYRGERICTFKSSNSFMDIKLKRETIERLGPRIEKKKNSYWSAEQRYRVESVRMEQLSEARQDHSEI